MLLHAFQINLTFRKALVAVLRINTPSAHKGLIFKIYVSQRQLLRIKPFTGSSCRCYNTHTCVLLLLILLLILLLDLDTYHIGSIIDPYQDLIIIINTHTCVIVTLLLLQCWYNTVAAALGSPILNHESCCFQTRSIPNTSSVDH